LEENISSKLIEAYGFDPDPNFTAHHNATIQLGLTPYWAYKAKPSNLAFHDLTENHRVPPAAASLLGLGSKFIPNPSRTTTKRDMEGNISRLYRDVSLAAHFADSWADDNGAPRRKASKLYVKSDWQPPAPPQELYGRVMSFIGAIEGALQGRTAMPNLLPFQQELLSSLRANTELVFPQADKGLGTCAVEIDKYINDALKNHLLDKKAYQLLSEEVAWEMAKAAEKAIFKWLTTYRRLLDDSAWAFIYKKTKENALNPFGYFYLLYKIHKVPLKTRPVCSDCASITHALGKWVDEQLQPIFKSRNTYFKNSFALKLELEDLKLDGNVSLFKYDAVAMYTNIDTDACLVELSCLLHDSRTRKTFPHYEPTMLMEAIEIVMRNNIMKFGDIFALQLQGVAMGISPAPPIASIFYSIHEDKMLPKWNHRVSFVRRFIDDGIAIWHHDPDDLIDDADWQCYQDEVSSFHGLPWDFDPRSHSLDYMDVTITIKDGKLTTTLFEKDLALYQYLPPNSSHPPGVLTGLVMGGVLRILQLCSDEDDADGHIHNLYRRLLSRGHQPTNLLPLFDRAITNAQAYLANFSKKKPTPTETKRDTIYLHIPFHPQDPPAKHRQKLWQEHMVQPPGKQPLALIDCGEEATFPIEKMTVCYSRHQNLGNYLSYRKLDKYTGRKVSSFI